MQRLVRAQVHNQINVVEVLKKVNKPHYLLMPHLLLDAHLPFQFRLAVVYVGLPAGVPRLKVRLGDYLTGELLFIRGDLDDTVTGREATFAQVLGLYVALWRLSRVVND